MKELDEIIEEFKNSEESKALDKVNEATKKLLSRKEVMNAMAEVTAEAIEASFEEKNKSVAMIRASLEGYRLIEKLFHEEPQEEKEPDAKFDDLKHRLFAHAAECRLPIQNATLRIAEIRRSAKYLGLLDLISDAGLQEEYDAWKEEKGYE